MRVCWWLTVLVKQVQEWLGHANFNTTANVYTHLEYASKIQSAKTISDLLADNKTDIENEEQKTADKEQKLLDKDSNKLIDTDENGLNDKDETKLNNKCELNKKNETKLNNKKESKSKFEIDEAEYNEFLEWRKKKQDMEM